MGSIKIEQQIPANHQCSVFNGLLLKIEKQAKLKGGFHGQNWQFCCPHQFLTFQVQFLSNDSAALDISF